MRNLISIYTSSHSPNPPSRLQNNSLIEGVLSSAASSATKAASSVGEKFILPVIVGLVVGVSSNLHREHLMNSKKGLDQQQTDEAIQKVMDEHFHGKKLTLEQKKEIRAEVNRKLADLSESIASSALEMVKKSSGAIHAAGALATIANLAINIFHPRVMPSSREVDAAVGKVLEKHFPGEKLSSEEIKKVRAQIIEKLKKSSKKSGDEVRSESPSSNLIDIFEAKSGEFSSKVREKVKGIQFGHSGDHGNAKNYPGPNSLKPSPIKPEKATLHDPDQIVKRAYGAGPSTLSEYDPKYSSFTGKDDPRHAYARYSKGYGPHQEEDSSFKKAIKNVVIGAVVANSVVAGFKITGVLLENFCKSVARKAVPVVVDTGGLLTDTAKHSVWNAAIMAVPDLAQKMQVPADVIMKWLASAKDMVTLKTLGIIDKGLGQHAKDLKNWEKGPGKLIAQHVAAGDEVKAKLIMDKHPKPNLNDTIKKVGSAPVSGWSGNKSVIKNPTNNSKPLMNLKIQAPSGFNSNTNVVTSGAKPTVGGWGDKHKSVFKSPMPSDKKFTKIGVHDSKTFEFNKTGGIKDFGKNKKFTLPNVFGDVDPKTFDFQRMDSAKNVISGGDINTKKYQVGKLGKWFVGAKTDTAKAQLDRATKKAAAAAAKKNPFGTVGDYKAAQAPGKPWSPMPPGLRNKEELRVSGHPAHPSHPLHQNYLNGEYTIGNKTDQAKIAQIKEQTTGIKAKPNQEAEWAKRSGPVIKKESGLPNLLALYQEATLKYKSYENKLLKGQKDTAKMIKQRNKDERDLMLAHAKIKNMSAKAKAQIEIKKAKKASDKGAKDVKKLVTNNDAPFKDNLKTAVKRGALFGIEQAITHTIQELAANVLSTLSLGTMTVDEARKHFGTGLKRADGAAGVLDSINNGDISSVEERQIVEALWRECAVNRRAFEERVAHEIRAGSVGFDELSKLEQDKLIKDRITAIEGDKGIQDRFKVEILRQLRVLGKGLPSRPAPKNTVKGYDPTSKDGFVPRNQRVKNPDGTLAAPGEIIKFNHSAEDEKIYMTGLIKQQALEICRDREALKNFLIAHPLNLHAQQEFKKMGIENVRNPDKLIDEANQSPNGEKIILAYVTDYGLDEYERAHRAGKR